MVIECELGKWLPQGGQIVISQKKKLIIIIIKNIVYVQISR